MGSRLLRARTIRQLGKESTRGTVVAAAHQSTHDWVITPDAVIARPDAMSGHTMRNRGNELVVTRGTAVSIPESEVAFDEIHRILGMSIQSGITPTTPGGGTLSREWAFTRSGTAAYLPDTFTLEDWHSDGSAHYGRRYPFLFLKDWTLTFTPDRPVMFSANGVARHDVALASANTLTDLSATYPRTETHVGAHNTVVGYHDTYASLGSATSLASDFLSASVRFNTGFSPVRALDGNTELDFTDVQFNPENAGVDVEFSCLAKSGSGDFFLDQKANAEAVTAQAFRFTTTGSLIEGSLYRLLRCDFWCKSEPGSYQISGAQDGQEIVTARFVETRPVAAWCDFLVRNTSTATTY